MDELLIKWEERIGSKIGPRGRGVEGLVDSSYEENRLEIVVSARPSIVMGELFHVWVMFQTKVNGDSYLEQLDRPVENA